MIKKVQRTLKLVIRNTNVSCTRIFVCKKYYMSTGVMPANIYPDCEAGGVDIKIRSRVSYSAAGCHMEQLVVILNSWL